MVITRSQDFRPQDERVEDQGNANGPAAVNAANVDTTATAAAHEHPASTDTTADTAVSSKPTAAIATGDRYRGLVFDNSPRSSSGTTEKNVINEHERERHTVTFQRAMSTRSTSAAMAKIRAAELEATERLAAIELRELRIEAELIKKRLAVQIDNYTAEENDEPLNEVSENIHDKVEDWLRRTKDAPAASAKTPHANAAESRGEQDNSDQWGKQTHRSRSPSRATAATAKTPRVDAATPRGEQRSSEQWGEQSHRPRSPSRATAATTKTPRVNAAAPRGEEDNSEQQRERSHHPRSPARANAAPTKIPCAHADAARGEQANSDQRGERSHRPRSPSCAASHEREHSSGRAIAKLADAIRDMVVKRPSTRCAIELPIFSGNPTEWLPFRAALRDSTNLYHMSPEENLARLRTCLRGEARELVAALLFTATHHRQIVATLEQYYGRPENIVEQALEEIRRLPRPGVSATNLNKFAIKVQNAVAILKNIDKEGYLQNPMLSREITEKLSPHLRSRWADFAEDHRLPEEPEIVALSRFLMREAERAVRYTYTPTASTSTNAANNKCARATNSATDRKNPANRAPVYTTTAEEKPKCVCCNGEHHLYECDAFKKNETNERWEIVKKARLCFKCIKTQHRRSNCKAKNCKCGRPHHTLLHADAREEQHPNTPAPKHGEAVLSTTAAPTAERAVLLKVCPVTVAGPLGEVNTFALLDEGSTISLIDEEIARMITDEDRPDPLIIHGVGSSQKLTASKRVEIQIKARGQSQYHDLNVRTMEDMKLRPQGIPRNTVKYNHLRDLKDAVYSHATPRVLVGADHWHLLVSHEMRMGARHEPAASRTSLGWVIYGTIPRALLSTHEGTVLHVVTSQPTDVKKKEDRLEEIIKAHYDIDALGVSLAVKLRPEEERAVKIFEETARRVDNRIEVGLPWRQDNIVTPPSYEEAFRRLKNIEKQMDRDPVYKKQYTAQVKNLIAKGYAEPCKDKIESNVKWYLPHFGVRNPHKPGKLRLVFDAAGRAKGVCLNDYLLEGPDRLRALPGILFRFRERPIAVSADIEEMFLQVKVRKEDQPALLFLWRDNDRSHPPQQYVMTSLIFGACCSPFIAHSARDKNASDFEREYPEAARAIRENHYMDDYLDSFDTVTEANQRIAEVTYVHRQASFNLRGWNSNSADVLKELQKETRASIANVDIGARPEQADKTLGILWDTRSDEIGFGTKMPRVPVEVKQQRRTPTKRETLSVVMSIYDPLGLIGQFTITAKLILQRLWLKQTGWDDQLPEEEAEDFAQWLSMLDDVTRLRIPRAHETDSTKIVDRQLHVFCDASEQAYATAAYWRTENEYGNINVSLVAAKSKVAPLRAQTIPRLELQAAVIGARLADSIKREHRLQPSRVIYWTDSSTVICWIRGNAKKITPFVTHRLGEIAQLTDPSERRWLPTAHNVADDATRAHYTPPTDDARWYRGPEFLYHVENHWPADFGEMKQDDIAQEEANYVVLSPATVLPDPKRTSSYTRLVNTTARVVLFIEKLRTRDRTLRLDVRHIEYAERLHIMAAQADDFKDKISCLKRGHPLPKSSRLYKIDPELRDGVLRVRGRIDAAHVSAEMKQPIILDGRHPFTRLLIRREHVAAQHANNERVINELRQRFWILNLRPAVGTAARTCQVCRIYRTQPKTPVRGNLPRARLDAYQRPFTNTGLDFFGPMTVKVGRRREKRWGALFTCLVTRAIHVELVPTLSTDSAIMALRRMASRRGWPRVIWSDNATNFRGADRELQAAYAEWLPYLRAYGLTCRLQWRYIAPGAPHQGGAWERMVRSVKTSLAAVLKEKVPTEETLTTLLCEAEHAVNSRPLTHVSVDPHDPEALTPNHFLLGTSSGLPMTGPMQQNERRMWRVAQALADEFWRRWMREYLPTLVPRGQADDQARTLQVGDLVIIADPNLPRNTWPRGVVEKTWPGPDGKVRQADVRTRGGVFRRPVSRLVALEVEAASEELRRGETIGDDGET